MGWQGAAADFLMEGHNGCGLFQAEYMDGQLPASSHSASPPPRPLNLLVLTTFRIHSWILIRPACTISPWSLLLKYPPPRDSPTCADFKASPEPL